MSPADPLRPVVELAFLVAALGVRQRPAVPAPAGLKPFLRHHKLPEAAVAPLRTALDRDPAFRERVLAAADERTVGEQGLAWLRDPAGAGVAHDVDLPPVPDRQVARTEHALREAKAALALSRTDVARLQARLTAADAKAAKAERSRVAMESEIVGLQQRLLKSETERDRLTIVLASTQSELRDTRAALVSSEQENVLSAARRPVVRHLASQPAATWSAAPTSKRVEAAKGPKRKRHKVRLPGGVAAGSVDAARFLLEHADVVHVIDGYNVAKLAYPTASLANQRDQLLDLCEQAEARFSSSITVVFDGDHVGVVPAARRRVAVQFSAAGVTADDHIVSLLTAAPLAQAVVVVTTDGAVREACDMLGAHLVHSADFFSAASRRA